jgi:tRNA-specific 2-thiouridylase
MVILNWQKKSESYEICFVPDNDYRGFLKRRVEGLEQKVNGGNFIDKNGNILGQHKGYPFYTIGKEKDWTLLLETCLCNENRSRCQYCNAWG